MKRSLRLSSDLGRDLNPSEAVRRRDEATFKERLLRAAYRSDAGLLLYLGGFCHQGIEESLLLSRKIRGHLFLNAFQLPQFPFYSFELRVIHQQAFILLEVRYTGYQSDEGFIRGLLTVENLTGPPKIGVLILMHIVERGQKFVEVPEFPAVPLFEFLEAAGLIHAIAED